MSSLYIALLSFFSLMIIFSIILAIALGDFKRYSCIDNECVVRKNGKYTTKSKCKKECKKIIPKPTPTKLVSYSCNADGTCSETSPKSQLASRFTAKSSCEQSCNKLIDMLPIANQVDAVFNTTYNIVNQPDNIKQVKANIKVDNNIISISFTTQDNRNILITMDKDDIGITDTTQQVKSTPTPVRLRMPLVMVGNSLYHPVTKKYVLSFSNYKCDSGNCVLETKINGTGSNLAECRKNCIPPSPISEDKNYFYVWSKLPTQTNKSFRLATIKRLLGSRYTYTLNDLDTNIILGTLSFDPNTSTYLFTDQTNTKYGKFDTTNKWITTDSSTPTKVVLAWIRYPKTSGDCNIIELNSILDNTLENVKSIYKNDNTTADKNCPPPSNPANFLPISEKTNYFYVWTDPKNKPSVLAKIKNIPNNMYSYELRDNNTDQILGNLNVIYNPSKKDFTYSFKNQDGMLYQNYDPKYRWISGIPPGDNEERVFLTFPIYPKGGNCRNFPAPAGVNTVNNFRGTYDGYNTGDGTPTYSFDPMDCVSFDNSDYKIIVDNNKNIDVKISNININSYHTYRNIISKNNKIGVLTYILTPNENLLNISFQLISFDTSILPAQTILIKCKSQDQTCILKNDENNIKISKVNLLGFSRYMKESYAYIPKTSVVRKNAF